MAMGWKRLVARKSHCQKQLQDRKSYRQEREGLQATKGYRPERAAAQKRASGQKRLQASKSYRPEREKGL